MPELKVEPLPFHPAQILKWDEGYIAISIDGDFLPLDSYLKNIGDVKKPFPSPVKNCVLIGNQLITTWVDHELMVARMGSFELGNQFENGPERVELRTRRYVDSAVHPAGVVWSHLLDAEPLVLCSNEEKFVFILWKKGIYAMGVDAGEHWRNPEPKWTPLENLPHAEVVISASIQGSIIHVWSRGSGHKTYDLKHGKILDSTIIEFDGVLESVYSSGKNHLLCYESGDTIWYCEGRIKKHFNLNGPVQYATWREQDEAWHIAGWREEILASEVDISRHRLDEIPVQILHHKDAVLLLLNDGSFISSSV
ncbi:MAG: hypothetical protein HOL22_03680 [Euryarchaeota archaeon]|jgi:hypothetical protein|nr:hypothetical protein [Euryarchaeota archaeon]